MGILYRVLLSLLGRTFGEEHREELVDFWTAQAREPRYRGVLGRARYVTSLTVDAVRAAARAGRAEGAGGSKMTTGRGDGTMRMLLQDLLYARRSLAGSPLFTALALVTLSLGIGATTAVYSVVSSVVLAPLPYPDSERLMDVPAAPEERRPRSISWPDFRDWRERSSAFLELAAFTEYDGTFEWEDGAEALRGAKVTRNFFEAMGVRPELGRTFTEEEDSYHGTEAIILGHALWQERFGGDPDIVGKTVPMAGEEVLQTDCICVECGQAIIRRHVLRYWLSVDQKSTVNIRRRLLIPAKVGLNGMTAMKFLAIKKIDGI